MNEKYIFMAEDNTNDTALMQRALRKCQKPNKLIVVSNGKDALNYLTSSAENAKPSVIILDLKLPLIDGLEVLRQIRSDESIKHLPVIILSASIDENDRLKSINLGADDFLCKPINFDDFVKMVSRICEQWL
ncbi:MAG: response regulator [Saccharofermentanales bacterium]